MEAFSRGSWSRSLTCAKGETLLPERQTPERSLIIVCEGTQDRGFLCALLKHHQIDAIDVVCPNKLEGNGESGIRVLVQWLLLKRTQLGLKGILIIRDADDDPLAKFNDCASIFAIDKKEMGQPTRPFKISFGSIRTGVFLLPGEEKVGCLDCLLLDAALMHRPESSACIEEYVRCTQIETWPTNKLAKAKLSSIIATTCKDDPRCSLAWIWSKDENPIPIGSKVFDNLVNFIRDFIAEEQLLIPELS